MRENEIAKIVVDVAFQIHKRLGPGLLESAYEAVMLYELRKRSMHVESQVAIPVEWDDVKLEVGFRASPKNPLRLAPLREVSFDQSAMLDGKAIPIVSAGQRTRIPETWIRNIHRSNGTGLAGRRRRKGGFQCERMRLPRLWSTWHFKFTSDWGGWLSCLPEESFASYRLCVRFPLINQRCWMEKQSQSSVQVNGLAFLKHGSETFIGRMGKGGPKAKPKEDFNARE